MSKTGFLRIMEAPGVFKEKPDVERLFQAALTWSGESDDPNFARAICFEAVAAFWKSKCDEHGRSGALPAFSGHIARLSKDVREQAATFGVAVSDCPLDVGAYYLSSLYVQSLPDLLRSQFGMYFTPPSLVARLLDMVDREGFDWEHGVAIDPACGGGAFIAPLARRMINRALSASSNKRSGAYLAEQVCERIRGIELESFCAWMSTIFLRLTLVELLGVHEVNPSRLVCTADTMDVDTQHGSQYDLVIGNPPYGKVTLPDRLRRKYAHSLFGHANLYGIFTHIAVNLIKPGGLVAYVTPTSFLGGQYFRNLRALLSESAPLQAIDFIVQREGVFAGVLQETTLAVFRGKPARSRSVTVHMTTPKGIQDDARALPLGRFKLDPQGDNPWILPRDKRHARMLRKAEQMRLRLGDLGFEVSTGPLVWNRHKEQLSHEMVDGALPLIWAESVRQDGQFRFTHTKRDHVPFIRIGVNQGHLVTRNGCVLIQRTTAKEQQRRILAARLPEQFVRTYGGTVIENHLNVVKPSNGNAVIDLMTLTVLLNSTAIDQLFRCINGSVAVSAYELAAMPLPDEAELIALQRQLRSGTTPKAIDSYINSVYGLAYA